MDTTLLQLQALTAGIAHITVARELSVGIHSGQCWGVLGRNGVGKTTLLHTLAGLRAPVSGSIELNGTDLALQSRRQIARTAGVLFQDAFDVFPATVMETALIGRHPHLELWQWESAEDRRRAHAALEAVGLDALAHRMVSTLSGGERRRLGIATLLTQDPVLLFLDEPTNHLDLHHQISVLALFQRLAAEKGKTLIMTLHDVNLALRFCDHVMLLFGDGEVEAGPAEALINPANLERLYNHPMRMIRDDGRTLFVPE